MGHEKVQKAGPQSRQPSPLPAGHAVPGMPPIPALWTVRISKVIVWAGPQMGSGGLAEALGSGAWSLWGVLGQTGHQASSAQDGPIISAHQFGQAVNFLLGHPPAG